MREKQSFQTSVQKLKRDKHIGPLIRVYGTLEYRKKRGAFESLAHAIVSQQLSGKAAETIWKRFKELFPKKKLTPTYLHTHISLRALRAVGLSNQKATYMIDLAQKFLDGSITPEKFPRMTDVDIIEHLLQVKGIGEWTAQMFLMFTLQRPDVLPLGDLGIQKGFQKIFHCKHLPSQRTMQRHSKSWEGHRTVASFYLWKSLENR